MLMKIEILTVSSDKKGMRKEYTSFLKTLSLFLKQPFVKMKGGTCYCLTGNRKLHYLKNGGKIKKLKISK